MWSGLGYHVVWVAVFQKNILLVSSGGCLNMEVACVFGTACIPDYFSALWIENEVIKWREDRVWYGEVVLSV
jgi:hypothetical protein